MAVKPTLEIWSDLDHKLVTDSRGAIKKSINVEAVKTSIDNILKTNPGERVMLPTFAAAFRGLLFEPINDRLMNRLSDMVKNTIEIWDDRIFIEEIGFKIDPDNSNVAMDLNFRIKSFYEVFTHTVIVSP